MIDIPGFEGIYSIADDGQIWSHYWKKFLSPCKNNCGYLYVLLKKDGKRKHYYVHRLVAESYVAKPQSTKKLEVNHIDGNKLNNHRDNLQWTTHSDNVQHAYDNGIHKKSTGIQWWKLSLHDYA